MKKKITGHISKPIHTSSKTMTAETNRYSKQTKMSSNTHLYFKIENLNITQRHCDRKIANLI